jgi:CHASE3 domain sensor protein
MVEFPKLGAVSGSGNWLTAIPLTFGFLALAVIVTMTFWLNQHAQENFNEVTADRSLRTAAIELRSNLQAAESSQRGYLYTGNEIYLSPYSVAKGQLQKQYEHVETGLKNYPQLQAAGDKLGLAISQKILEMDASIDLKKNGDDARSLSLIQTNRGKALMDETNVYLSGIIRATEQKLIAGIEEQQKNTSILRWVSIVGALVILGMALLAAYFVTNHTRSLAKAREEVTALNQSL